MRKKLVSLALALTMGCALAAPAGAASTAEDRLSAVTAKVKAALNLDTAAFTEFHGNLEENVLAPVWNLEWSASDGRGLSVNATEEGKILWYYLQENRETLTNRQTAPAFPSVRREEAREAALAFLGKVLSPNESAVLKDRGTDRLNASQYGFRGEVLVNGLPAGLTFSISVDCESGQVQSFHRDDLAGRVTGGVPDNRPTVLSGDAGRTLRDTLKLRLEYVLPKDGDKKAVLRYLPESPESGDAYYVDAADGRLVNLTELQESVEMGNRGLASKNMALMDGAEAEEAAAAGMPIPTPAETAGAEKLKGVLEKDVLDKKARAVAALGLKAYTLSSASYSVPREEAEDQTITASLLYGRQVNGVSWRRTVVLDARTGALIRVSSSGRMPEEEVKRPVDFAAAQKNAEAFLKAQCGAQFAKTELYNSSDALESRQNTAHSFQYAQKANGYFLPANSLYVEVDATDGSIAVYRKEFDDSVVFDSPDGILTMEQALDAWLGTYDVTLQYVRFPVAVDYSQPEYAPLRDLGVAYLYRLVLGYRLERETYLPGIDAKTGKPVEYPEYIGGSVVYDDLEGCWARKQIEALAQYQVGYTGGKFRPNKALTQSDLILLMASTQGHLIHPSAATNSADYLYEEAYRMGMLRREERNDDAVLTRMDAIRLILNAVGYGEAARLQGIYQVRFSDAGHIADGDLGYAALAQGFGMVSSDGDGKLSPDDAADRAQAAVMLYNLLARRTFS